ncbi:MAG: TIGR04076 family protein [Bacillota bacterium]
MAQIYDIVVTVVSQTGECSHGHKVGDSWRIGGTTPAGLCLSALDTMLTNVRTMQFGGEFPWESDPERTTVSCPDSANPVVFELRRVKR